jgi:hypothetical protein
MRIMIAYQRIENHRLRQHGTMRQFIQDGHDFLVAQPLNVIAAAWHRLSLPRLKERHGSRAFAADVTQQRKVVLTRHLKLRCNQAAHPPFGRQTCKEQARFAIVKRLCWTICKEYFPSEK